MLSQSILWNLLCIILLCMLHPNSFTEGDQAKDSILCRECGSDVASALSLVNLHSPAAINRVNKSIFGREEVDIQTIRNPLNIQFEIVTVLDSTCAASSKEFFIDHSWYPGYAWKPCKCSRCRRHLGWLFEPLHSTKSERTTASNKGFYALSVAGLISELYSNELLIAPKTVYIR